MLGMELCCTVKEMLIDSHWQKTKSIRCVTLDNTQGLKNMGNIFLNELLEACE